MDGFTIIDAVVAVVIVLSAVLAYARGLVREVMAIIGWVAAAVLAFTFAAMAQPLVLQIPVVGEFLGDSCELSMVAAFAVIFALSLVVISLFTPLLSSTLQGTAVGSVDQALGFAFGAARGIVLVAVAFLVYDKVIGAQTVPMVDNSRSAHVFASFQGKIDAQVPDDAPGWVVQQYEKLVGTCGVPVQPIAPEVAPAPQNG
ncbi:CvpA family protein [Falsirhodobacter sp. 20TX0035]|uniref:CvpA family protein n=1 Tax=Falsirhodobacter sp. 20TX0035 TaxID=3022019 RepID=UPI0023313948|nr:CvpA family protein [Falsirhodobacter sp. 20TX0035]MDB6455152.1 CvpA family protein [Falsirhodobacter sp. 20TX0035]